MVEKDMLLLEKTMAIRQLEKSAVETNRNVEHLKKKMAALMREKQQMIDAQSDKENALRLKYAELQLFKKMMTKQGKREDKKELEEIIQAKELEIAKLRDELAECEKMKEVAEESSKLRNELLLSSYELSMQRDDIRHLQTIREDLRGHINFLRDSMEFQSRQQSDREKHIEVRGIPRTVHVHSLSGWRTSMCA